MTETGAGESQESTAKSELKGRWEGLLLQPHPARAVECGGLLVQGV